MKQNEQQSQCDSELGNKCKDRSWSRPKGKYNLVACWTWTTHVVVGIILHSNKAIFEKSRWLLSIFFKSITIDTSEPHEEGVLPYRGYIGMCDGIGYGFWGSGSLNRVSLFYPFVTVFLVWSLDRVAKLYHLMPERENACLNKRF